MSTKSTSAVNEQCVQLAREWHTPCQQVALALQGLPTSMMVSMLMVAVVMQVLRLLIVAPISRPMLCTQTVRCQSIRGV